MKKILKIVLAVLFFVGIVLLGIYFNYRKTENQDIKYFCYQKKDKNSERIIKIKMVYLDKVKKEAVSGSDIFRNAKYKEQYYFTGIKEGDKLIVFGNRNEKNNGEEVWERVYKIKNDGIIESENIQDIYQLNQNFGKKVYEVRNLNKLSFPEKNKIKEVDCD